MSIKKRQFYTCWLEIALMLRGCIYPGQWGWALAGLHWCFVWVKDLSPLQWDSPLNLGMRLPSADFCSKRGTGSHPAEVCGAAGLHHYHGHHCGHGQRYPNKRERKSRGKNEGYEMQNCMNSKASVVDAELYIAVKSWKAIFTSQPELIQFPWPCFDDFLLGRNWMRLILLLTWPYYEQQ